jgi:hypothetical protein
MRRLVTLSHHTQCGIRYYLLSSSLGQLNRSAATSLLKAG